jgi:hypothetical protein
MEKKAYDKGDKSGISEKKILLLEQAGFVWAKRKGQAAWEEKFLELQSYLQRHGHCTFAGIFLWWFLFVVVVVTS